MRPEPPSEEEWEVGGALFKAVRRVATGLRPEEAEGVLVRLLGSLGASLKSVGGGLVEAVHGSYGALTPSGARKAVRARIYAGDRGSIVEVEVDYTGYAVANLVASIVAVLVGASLLLQVLESYEFLEAIGRNPFMILVLDVPWLLRLLDSLGVGLETLDEALLVVGLFSAALLIGGLAGLVETVLLPRTAEELAARLAAELQSAAAAAKPGQARPITVGVEAAESTVQGPARHVSCRRTSATVITCSIQGIDPDTVRKLLALMGFSTAELSGVIVGVQRGSVWANEFPAKKMSARAVVEGDRATIVFEATPWNPFTDRDAAKAEEVLRELLSR